MAFHYKSVVPWGRNLDEYIRMFGLDEKDLKKKILGCGDGPASFNAQITELGNSVISIDPVYRFSREEIRNRIDETYEDVITQTGNNQDQFIWTSIRSVQELGRIRMAAMEKFLEDYDRGKEDGRYISGELPVLPFRDRQFDIALSSHFLFLYTDNLSLDFHIQAIKEMLRVSAEVRIFPLLDANAETSSYLEPVMEQFRAEGRSCEIIPVNYEFQKGGNRMLKIGRHLS